MSADSRTVVDDPACFTLPRLTRRHALTGVVALLAPLSPRILAAAPSASTDRPGLIRSTATKIPTVRLRPPVRRFSRASATAPRYADATIDRR